MHLVVVFFLFKTQKMSGDINLDISNSNSASTDTDTNTRLDLVTYLENTEKIKPLHDDYESKCEAYLAEKYNLDSDFINKNVYNCIDIHDLVRKIKTRYRQSRRNFDYFTKKFSSWLSDKCLNLPKKRGRKKKIKISESTAEECLNTVLEYLKQHGMIDKGIY